MVKWAPALLRMEMVRRTVLFMASLTRVVALSNTGENEWKTIFQPVLDSLSNSASTVGQDIANLFATDKAMNTGQLLKSSAEIS